MALPKAVQRQVEEANRIIDEMNAAKTTEPALTIVENTETIEQPAVAATPEVVEVVEEHEEPPAPKPPSEDYEQRYKVLQGKYDAEVPRLHRQVNELTEQLNNMQQVLADLKTPPAPQTISPASFVTPEEVEEYGSDLIDLVGRRAKEVYEPTINELKSELATLKGQLSGVTENVAVDARGRLLSKLSDKVENWEQQNNDPEFLDWLNKLDPYSGEVRGRMLRAAFEANDADRVIAFFTGFRQEHAAVSPPATTDSVEPTNRTPAVDLNSQVAPGKAKKTSAPASAQNEKRMWTRPEIAAFYTDVQKGVFKNREDEKKALEKDIFLATVEGRIR